MAVVTDDDGSYFVSPTVFVTVEKNDKTQIISLKKGWNLISINVHTADSSIETLFTNLDVQEIKTLDKFWMKGQNNIFNSLSVITSGNGYLVKMNNAGTLMVTGTPDFLGFQNLEDLPAGWSLLGCPFQSASPFSTYFNTSNCSIIRSFDGLWMPNGTTNSISNLDPGKGYFMNVIK